MARALLLSLALLPFGCGGDDDGPDQTSDAAGHDAAPTAADAGADAMQASCDGPGDCPCFTNHDCPETHACVSQDDTGENVWCLEGERGTGEAGTPCTGEEDCKSALCVDGDEGLFCSDVCEDERDCPESLPDCLYIGFGTDVSICAPA